MLTGYSISPYTDGLKAYILLAAFATTFSIVRAQKHTGFENCTSLARVRGQVVRFTVPCLVLAFFCSYNLLSVALVPSFHMWMRVFSPLEFMWAFSMYLSVVADIPQLKALRGAEKKDKLVVLYVVLVFAFRAFYLPHWVLMWAISSSFSRQRF